jgi:hypothetical protein
MTNAPGYIMPSTNEITCKIEQVPTHGSCSFFADVNKCVIIKPLSQNFALVSNYFPKSNCLSCYRQLIQKKKAGKNRFF